MLTKNDNSRQSNVLRCAVLRRLLSLWIAATMLIAVIGGAGTAYGAASSTRTWSAMSLRAQSVAGQSTTSQSITDQAQQMLESLADTIGCKPGHVLAQSDWFVAGDSVSDWMAMALSLAGVEEDYRSYLQALETEVTRRYAEKGCLDEVKATEYHRIALTVKALGGDPTAFGRHGDGSPVNLIDEGILNYDGDLGAQGLNGYLWALIALNSGDYGGESSIDKADRQNDNSAANEEIKGVSEDAAVQPYRYSEEMILEAILDRQLPDGAFGLTDTADADITAMAVQALAPYREQEAAAAAIDSALNWLSGQLTDDCGLISYGSRSPESAAQLLIALTSLGIDPETDERFVRGGQTLLTQLEQFYLGGGIYTHSLEEPAEDYMATEQCVLGLLAVERLRQDGGRLYDLGQIEPAKTRGGGISPILWIAGGGVLAAVLILGVILRSKANSKHTGTRRQQL